MADSIEQLSFSLAIDELAEQERSLATLRTCAGTVLAAASVALLALEVILWTVTAIG